MQLLILILLATLCYSLFQIFVSRSARGIDPNVGAMIFNGIGVLIPLIIFTFLKYGRKTALLPTSKEGILYSVLAGISVALYSVLLVKIFEKGGLAYVVPLIFGGSIVVSSLVGWLVFKETISSLQGLGVVITALGVAIVVVSKLSFH